MRSPTSSRRTPPVPARRPIRLAALCLLTVSVAAQVQPQVVKDLNPRPVPALVREHPIVLFGPHAYFPGFANRTGEELYRAGTTSPSLQLLIDAHSGRGSGHPFALTPMGGKLYFMVDDGTHVASLGPCGD